MFRRTGSSPAPTAAWFRSRATSPGRSLRHSRRARRWCAGRSADLRTPRRGPKSLPRGRFDLRASAAYSPLRVLFQVLKHDLSGSLAVAEAPYFPVLEIRTSNGFDPTFSLLTGLETCQLERLSGSTMRRGSAS